MSPNSSHHHHHHYHHHHHHLIREGTETTQGRAVENQPTELIACVASVSSRGSSRKLGQEHQPFFFCFRSNFRAITRLETLATQATELTAWACCPNILNLKYRSKTES